jgi:multidrug efflux pump subunit AcrA (membrane-fusion protein)
VTIFLSLTAVVGLFLGGTTFIVSNHEGAPLPTTTVKHGPITIKITETGELRAEDQVTISAANDKMILWMAPEGSWVEEGDTLVVFESEKYVIARSEASSNVDVAKADKSAPADSLVTPQAADSLKTGTDFELTRPDTLLADSVASAVDFNFALSDSLLADSVKNRIQISRGKLRDF